MSATISPFDRLMGAELPRELRADQGSGEITVWCPCCLERTIPGRNGCCMFCDTPLTDQAQTRDAEAALPLAHESARKRGEQPKSTVRIPRRRKRSGNRHARAYTDEQLVARVQLWAAITGAPPSKADWNPAKLKSRAAKAREKVIGVIRLLALYELGDFPSETTVRKRFGSLNALLVLAGFDPRTAGRQPTTGAGIGRPKIGREAVREYIAEVEASLEDDDGPTLKANLYLLSLSAMWTADRMRGTYA